MRRNGLMNWVPDGVVLSKLSNGPDQVADAEYDARSGQLFNIGISGPSVTKTWTGDYRLAAQPMDKVFMLIVGDLHYELAAPNPVTNSAFMKGMRRCFAPLGIGLPAPTIAVHLVFNNQLLLKAPEP